jgi:hypothetical protein
MIYLPTEYWMFRILVMSYCSDLLDNELSCHLSRVGGVFQLLYEIGIMSSRFTCYTRLGSFISQFGAVYVILGSLLYLGGFDMESGVLVFDLVNCDCGIS